MSKLNRLKELVIDNVLDVEDLVRMLELDIEDILDRHSDALLEHAHKFGDFDVEQDGETGEAGEEEEEGYNAEWDE